MYIVYKHTGPQGKVYIGITKQMACQRWARGKGYRNNFHFYNAIQKYGWDNFQHEILFEGLSKEAAEQKEIELIQKYDCIEPKGYNRSPGGNARPEISEETRQKLIKAHTGLTHVCSEEAKIRIGNANRGRKMPESAKKILSEKHKGKKNTEYQKMIASQLCKARVGELNPNYGKPSNHRKPIIATNIETCEDFMFDSVQNAAITLAIPRTGISSTLSGKQKTCYGYCFREVTK